MTKGTALLPSAAQPLVRWGQLYGSAAALWITRAAKQLQAPLVIITANARELAQLEDELKFYASGTDVQIFPGWETLPYDLFSAHPDIVSQRLKLLSRLPSANSGIVLVDLETILQRIAPKQYVDAHALEIRRGMKLDLETFRMRLGCFTSGPRLRLPVVI